MAKQRKTLRLTILYNSQRARVVDQEMLGMLPVTADKPPADGSDAHWLTLEGSPARFARRLPDPEIGVEVFHPGGGISRAADQDRLAVVDVPWVDDGREVVFRGPGKAPAGGPGKGLLAKKAPAWRELGRFSPSTAAPSASKGFKSKAKTPAFPVVTLFEGAGKKALKLIFLAEGFQAAELGRYAAVVDDFIALLRNTDPFRTHMGALSALRVDSPSAQSGIDDPEKGIAVKTLLDGKIGGKGDLRRLMVVDQKKAVDHAKRAAGKSPFVALVVVNTPDYGGSGGAVAVFSCDSRASNIALHELGHTLFGLADEYSYAGNDMKEPSEVNVTRKPDASSRTWGPKDRDKLKWKAHLTAGLALPTTSNPECGAPHDVSGPAGVGLFEGGKYRHCGVWRPSANCKMRNIDQPFCPVCQAEIVRKLTAYT